MIRVDKGKDPNKILAKKGLDETNRAIAHFAVRGKKLPYKFKVYAVKEVKDALIKIFHNKCAYCESKFLAVYPGDVEHFRPKGAVIQKELDKKTYKYKNKILSENGYYWLAAKWENL